MYDLNLIKLSELERKLKIAKKALRRISDPEFTRYDKMVDECIRTAKEALEQIGARSYSRR